ncbi:hypothetical protein [Halomonas saccharevitans]|uniref:Helix-turn-helix domain-containing protein n=1 Tax=Halomonas saccharevitans TaxID=416872 RepID=A0A1I7AYN8_9GAMM|nr:hypothetical protein [Halomonas saccharevitans]SFT80045.1 hypothetical protein SAMN04487956_12118 [Halomonas saccharevitans]
MTHSLLWLGGVSLSPETRWWLWQWSRHIGLDRPVTCSLRTLPDRLQVPDSQGQATLRSLKASGWIEATPAPNKGRGRSCETYRVAPSLVAKLAALPQPSVPLADCIESVSGWEASGDKAVDDVTTAVKMTPIDGGSKRRALETLSDSELPMDGSDNGGGDGSVLLSPLPPNLRKGHARKYQLTSANRWLVMVLLAHADSAGQVIGLGFSELKSLTGMGRSRLHSQLSKLKRLGLLGHYQPGRMGLGGRRTSLFTLNLSHPAFGRRDRLCVDLLIWTPRTKGAPLPPMTEINGLAEALFVVAMLESRSSGGVGPHGLSDGDEAVFDDARWLLPAGFRVGAQGAWLAEHYDEALAHWLQCRLQAYALQLLARSEGSDASNIDDVAVRHPDVVKAIVDDFPRWPQDASSLGGDADALPPQVTLFYPLARHLAVQLQDLLELANASHDAVDVTSLDFCLIPDNRDRQAAWRLYGFAKSREDATSPIGLPATLDPVTSDFAVWLRRRQQASAWVSGMSGPPGGHAQHHGKEGTDSGATRYRRLPPKQ